MTHAIELAILRNKAAARARLLQADAAFAALDRRLALTDRRRDRIERIALRMDAEACQAENLYRADLDDAGKDRAAAFTARRFDAYRTLATLSARRVKLVNRLNALVNEEAEKNSVISG